MKREEPNFVVCVNNRGYAAALQVSKLYRTVPDASAAELRQIRVIDESGEDYLYPAAYFVSVQVPQTAQRAVLRAVQR